MNPNEESGRASWLTPPAPGARAGTGSRLLAAAGEAAGRAGRVVWEALWGDQRTFGPAALRLGNSRARRAWCVIGVSIGAIAVFALVSAEGIARADATSAPAYVWLIVAAVFVAGLLFLPGSPLRAWRVTTLAMLLGSAMAPGDTSWPWPVSASLGYLFVIFLVGLRHGPRCVAGAWIVTSLAVIVPAVGLSHPLTVMAIACATGLAALSGAAISRQRDAETQVRAQRETIQADAIRRAVLEERTAIARELHDVVAHHMSMIAIQAQAAQVRDREMTEPTRAALALIEQTARDALGDARRLVAVLREEVASPAKVAEAARPGAAVRRPQPCLAGIEALVAEARAAGQRVSYEAGVLADVPQAVEISAYRIVQEALSNARRHAPGAPVSVRLRRTEDALDVRVVNQAPAGQGSGS